MSKMSMPFRGRTITTTISKGPNGWLAVIVAFLVLALLGATIRGAVAFAAGGGWAALNEAIATVLGWAVGIAGAIAGIAFLVVVALVLPDAVDLPAARRARREFHEREDAARVEARKRRLARERAAAVAEQQLADEEPAGLDGTRDGVLIDAAGRFRSLGHVDPTTVDHEPVDRGRRSTGGA